MAGKEQVFDKQSSLDMKCNNNIRAAMAHLIKAPNLSLLLRLRYAPG